MRAEDLIIGNYIMVSDNYYQVDDIKKERGEYRISLRGTFAFATEEEIEPIPLTDEILKKNGFEYHHKNMASLSYEHPFKLEMVEWPDENGIGLWMIGGIIKIQYVHEMQNALKMAKIEKEIRLW